MANTNDEEIIEKRPSHPIATACLVLAAIGLLGAIVFQVLEISEVRSGLVTAHKSKDNPHKLVLDDYTKVFQKACQDVEKANDYPDFKPAITGEKGAPPTGDAKADEKTEEAPADAKAEEKTEEAPADAKAEEKTEEAPADAKAEEKTEEAPADADEKAGEKTEDAKTEEAEGAPEEKTE